MLEGTLHGHHPLLHILYMGLFQEDPNFQTNTEGKLFRAIATGNIRGVWICLFYVASYPIRKELALSRLMIWW